MKTIDLQLVTRPDVTLIPNSIIDKDMLEANELQLKVYLHILRNISAGISVDISSMADHFNQTEKDIARAISFWEKRDVLRLKAAPAPAPADVTATVSRDTFDSLTDKQDFQEISFVAETYMGKTLSKTDIETLLFIKENLHFSNELIEYLLEYCAERGKKSFKYVQTVAFSWSKQGITTPEDARLNSAKYTQRIFTVMNALGKKNEPTIPELQFINSWYDKLGFESDVILDACNRTVLATDKNRFQYCNKILTSWHASGVHHASDITRMDASYQQTQKKANETPAKVPGYVANNPFLHFKQSDTDYDALEKELLQN